ncbi:hypothetical protein L1987_75120 [Smallanthus sonchifolius]|uniref:Uncharacterized protein n=1 Tax=Smallanthus sonchifolius TaxID=185202 RepID=A0ACB9A5U2_9ASTR|nr:hypothetical protein L1987_75120 [Smallanthus sonchifolius]
MKQLCNRKKFLTMSRETGSLTLGDLLLRMSKHKKVGENLTEDERVAFLHDSYQNLVMKLILNSSLSPRNN